MRLFCHFLSCLKHRWTQSGELLVPSEKGVHVAQHGFAIRLRQGVAVVPIPEFELFDERAERRPARSATPDRASRQLLVCFPRVVMSMVFIGMTRVFVNVVVAADT